MNVFQKYNGKLADNEFLCFLQVIVRGGGHILPYDQPERSFVMIDRFLSTDGFSSH